MIDGIGIQRQRLSYDWHTPLLRVLCVASCAGIAVLIHLPTHLASAVGRIFGQPLWVDTVAFELPPALRTLFWVPLFLLVAALVLRNHGTCIAAESPSITCTDLVVSFLLIMLGGTIRLWPLLQDPSIKPNYDEGVMLGAAWLVHNGALPYRDFVLAHLPGSLALLWPGTWLIAPLHDNLHALLAARATAALSDGVAIGLLYLTARQLVAMPGAILAAFVYACDAFVVQFARGVRLEPLQAPWLIAGALLILATLNGRRMGFAAGLFLALGLTIKITGVVVLIAALGCLVLERRWATLRDVALGALLGVIAICGWAVVTSGDEIVRQTVLLQLMRPADSADHRWSFVLGDSHTAFSALSFLCGTIVLATQLWRHRVASGWLFICLWGGLTLVQFAYASSFYDHYYVTLVPPLALLATAIPSVLRDGRWRLAASIGLVGLLTPLWWGQVLLWPTIGMSSKEEQAYARVIALPPQDRVLSFVPLLSIAAGRPFAHPAGGPYILDTFLGTIYLDSPLNQRWPQAAETMRTALQSADDVVSDPWTQPLPGLTESFAAQWLIPKSMLLYTRVDQPAMRVQLGAHLQMLTRTPGRYAVVKGERSIMQPLHWRASETPPQDLFLALHLLDGHGTRVAQLDVPVSANTAWKPGEITTLEYRIPLPPALAPGTYFLKAIVSGHGQMDTIDLPPVIVEP